MRFYSQFPQIRYTAEPSRIQHWGPNQKETIPGLHAQFHHHTLDSNTAQRSERWTDEQREQVEQYLLHHADFGVTLQLVDDQTLAVSGEQVDRPYGSCPFMVVTDEGTHVCGEPIETEGWEQCNRHHELVTTASQPKAVIA